MKDIEQEYKILKDRLNNMEIEPEDNLWQNIQKELPKNNHIILKTLTISGGVIILGLITMLILAPEKEIRKIDVKPSYNQVLTTQQNTIIPTKKTIQQKENSTDVAFLTKNDNKKEIVVDNTINNNTTTNNNTNISTNNANINSNNNNIVLSNIISPMINNNIVANKSIVVSKDNNIEKTAIVVNDDLKNNPQQEDTIKGRMRLFIPDAFTPMESTNNVFKPAKCELKSYEIFIFARNGKRIFHSNDIEYGWDGKIKGSYAPMGSYSYYIKFENTLGYRYTQKGNIMLIR